MKYIIKIIISFSTKFKVIFIKNIICTFQVVVVGTSRTHVHFLSCFLYQNKINTLNDCSTFQHYQFNNIYSVCMNKQILYLAKNTEVYNGFTMQPEVA